MLMGSSCYLCARVCVCVCVNEQVSVYVPAIRLLKQATDFRETWYELHELNLVHVNFLQPVLITWLTYELVKLECQ